MRSPGEADLPHQNARTGALFGGGGWDGGKEDRFVEVTVLEGLRLVTTCTENGLFGTQGLLCDPKAK